MSFAPQNNDSLDFARPEVAQKFGSYPPKARRRLLALRQLILDTALTATDVGDIEETLKWDQPSYLPKRARTGTTIRIDAVPSRPDKVALYVHCQTNLIARFAEAHRDAFELQGKRAVILDVTGRLPKSSLRTLILMALRYHRDKLRGAS